MNIIINTHSYYIEISHLFFNDRYRTYIKDIQMKLWFVFWKPGIGMYQKLTKWLVGLFNTKQIKPQISDLSPVFIGFILYLQIVDCLNWRVQNEIDDILSVSQSHSSLGKFTKTCLVFNNYFLNCRIKKDWTIFLQKIITPELYRDIRDTQLIGLSGYSNTVCYKTRMCFYFCHASRFFKC